MTNVLLFWKNYASDLKRHGEEALSSWHSNSGIVGKLQEGDQIWLVSSGKILKLQPESAGFLIAIVQVVRVEGNRMDAGSYSSENFKYRVIFDQEKTRLLEPPINIDEILRPADRDETIPIGRFLQGPRKIKDERLTAIEKQIRE